MCCLRVVIFYLLSAPKHKNFVCKIAVVFMHSRCCILIWTQNNRTGGDSAHHRVVICEIFKSVILKFFKTTYELVFRLLSLRKLYVITGQYGWKRYFAGSFQWKTAILNFKKIWQTSWSITMSQADILPSWAWFRVCTATYMRSALFWDVAQSGAVIPYRRFGTTYRAHLQE